MTDDLDGDRFIARLEELGEDQVRLLLSNGGLPQPLQLAAIKWLAKKSQESEVSREATRSEQAEAARLASAAAVRAAAASERSSDAAERSTAASLRSAAASERQATAAERANTRATIALVIATISIAITIFGTFRSH